MSPSFLLAVKILLPLLMHHGMSDQQECDATINCKLKLQFGRPLGMVGCHHVVHARLAKALWMSPQPHALTNFTSTYTRVLLFMVDTAAVENQTQARSLSYMIWSSEFKILFEVKQSIFDSQHTGGLKWKFVIYRTLKSYANDFLSVSPQSIRKIQAFMFLTQQDSFILSLGDRRLDLCAYVYKYSLGKPIASMEFHVKA